MKKRIVNLVILLAVFAAVIGLSTVTGLFSEMAKAFQNVKVSGATILKEVAMILFVAIVVQLIRLILSSFHFKRHELRTFCTVTSSLVKYAGVIVIICWGLLLLEVDLNTVFASVGLLALIVGFGAESLIEDVITGVFMLFENLYNIGDIIEVQGFRGTVDNIGIRTTIIKDSGNNKKVFNNSEMKGLLNRSKEGSCAVADIGVPLNVDLLKLEEALKAELSAIKENNPDIFETEPRYLGVQKFVKNCMVLRFVADVAESDFFKAQRVLNRELYLALRKQQIDVHGVSFE